MAGGGGGGGGGDQDVEAAWRLKATRRFVFSTLDSAHQQAPAVLVTVSCKIINTLDKIR